MKLPTSSDDGEDGHSESDGGSFTLRNIDFSVKAGELLCVIGRVGSGKSSLVRCRLLIQLNDHVQHSFIFYSVTQLVLTDKLDPVAVLDSTAKQGMLCMLQSSRLSCGPIVMARCLTSTYLSCMPERIDSFSGNSAGQHLCNAHCMCYWEVQLERSGWDRHCQRLCVSRICDLCESC